jgi:hypothetical protein
MKEISHIRLSKTTPSNMCTIDSLHIDYRVLIYRQQQKDASMRCICSSSLRTALLKSPNGMRRKAAQGMLS